MSYDENNNGKQIDYTDLFLDFLNELSEINKNLDKIRIELDKINFREDYK